MLDQRLPVQYFSRGGLPSLTALLAVYLVFVGAVFLPFTALFWLRRGKEPLHSRSAVMVVYQMVWLLLSYTANTTALYLVHTQDSDSARDAACQLYFWLGAQYVPMTTLPYIIRGMRLYIQYMRSKLMLADSRVALKLAPELPLREMHRAIVRACRWMLTWKGSVLLIGLSSLATIVIQIPLYVLRDTTDPLWINTNGFAYLQVAQVIVIVGLATPMVMLVWLAQDAYSIRDELTAVLLIGTPTAILYLLAIFTVIDVSIGTIMDFQLWLFFVSSVVWPVIKSYSFERVRARFLSTTRLLTSERRRSSTGRTAGSTDNSSSVDRDSSTAAGVTTSSVEMVPVTPRTPLSPKMPDTPISPDAPALDASAVAVDEEGTIPAPGPDNKVSLKRTKSRRAHRSDEPHGNGLLLSDMLHNPSEIDRLLKQAVLCFSAELVLFVLDVQRFRDEIKDLGELADNATVLLHASQIAGLYIQRGAPREINVVEATRRHVLETLRKQRASKAPEIDELRTLFSQADAEARALIRTNILPHLVTPATPAPPTSAA